MQISSGQRNFEDLAAQVRKHRPSQLSTIEIDTSQSGNRDTHSSLYTRKEQRSKLRGSINASPYRSPLRTPLRSRVKQRRGEQHKQVSNSHIYYEKDLGSKQMVYYKHDPELQRTVDLHQPRVEVELETVRH